MKTVYLNIPELPNQRHFMAGDTHVINKAAPEDNVIYQVTRRTEKPPEVRLIKKMRAPL